MFRIKKYEKGYVVEIRRKLLFYSYWTHYISVAGLGDLPWYFSTKAYAVKEFLRVIEGEIRRQE